MMPSLRSLTRLGVSGAMALALTALPARAAWEAPLVLTQVPLAAQREAGGNSRRIVRADGFEDARLVVVSPEGAVRVLSEGFQSACDPDVSFDGQRVLFAGRKERAARWRIWEIGVDGRSLRAITPENLEARSPIHVSTLFTLDSPEPWFTTVFVGQESAVGEAGGTAVSSLYNIKLDGSELRRLTFNPNRNFDPFQMWDGRVIYSAERHPNEPGGRPARIGLYAIHLEGADMEFYGGLRGRRVQQMACATPGGQVVFVESDGATEDGAGQLAGLEERRPHVTYRPLTTDGAWVFAHPSPVGANRVLVARRPSGGSGNWGIVAFEAEGGRCEPVFDSPEYHDLQAVVLKPRPRPDGHSTVVDTRTNSGIFYGLNCYDADVRMAPHLPAGTVKRVRFIEGVVQPPPAAPDLASRGPFVPRRLVGEAPVEADGSFNVEVPADTPLLLQTLDERGLALANCGWIWVKPKEKRGCIGCHEDPERIPENEYVLALRRPSNVLTLPPAQRRNLSFRNEIAPLLRKHCATADCHGGEDTPLHLSLTSEKATEPDLLQAYAALTVPAQPSATTSAPWPAPGRYLDPGRARTSWLVWQLTGVHTARPWDRDRLPANDPRTVKPMPPAGQGTPLRPEDIRTLIQWIDLGAPLEPARLAEPKTP